MNSEITVYPRNIPPPYGVEAEAGAIEGIGARPGPWLVKLFESASDTDWWIHIVRPDGRKLRFCFRAEEQTRRTIRETVNRLLA